MNTAIALPDRSWLSWTRIRSLFNGLGFCLAITLMTNVWAGLQLCLQLLLSGHVREFVQGFWLVQLGSVWSEGPGLLFIAPIVNLAPRSGWQRWAVLFLAAIPNWWWCLYIAEGVKFGWNWPSVGFVLDGFLSIVPGFAVVLYYNESRAATDALVRTQIDRAGLDAEQQRAQLRLLRAQIEPHFLFNTLSVVRALARSDRAATVEMLDNLIRYFDAALPQLRESEVPLAQELQLVEAYLAIYRARMGSRLSYEVVATQDLGLEPVPCMMLLTLVENALKHGIGPSVEGGFIRVSAARERESLLLKVADSGRGLDAYQGHGMGLANIRQRLLMMYGSAAVLSLRPAEPRGMVASILLPAR